MSQIYPLDSVIRRVNYSELPKDSPSKKGVMIDKNGKHLPRKPLFGEVRCYLVSTVHSAESQISACRIKDISTGLAISLNVTYEVSCQAEQAVKIVQALYDGPHPGAVLEGLICRWLQAFARCQKHDGNPFIRGYFHGLKNKQKMNLIDVRKKKSV